MLKELGFKNAPKRCIYTDKQTEELFNYRSQLGSPHDYKNTENKEIKEKLYEVSKIFKLGNPIRWHWRMWNHPIYSLFESLNHIHGSKDYFRSSYNQDWMMVYRDTEAINLDHVIEFEYGFLSAPYDDDLKEPTTLAIYINSKIKLGIIVFAKPLDFKYHHVNTYPFVVAFKTVSLLDLFENFKKFGTWKLNESLF